MTAGKRESFGSRFAIVMALAGSAVGLGNIWRFPYMVGEYGGAAFIIIYILCSALISLPIFFSESIIGKASGQNPFSAMKSLSGRAGWKLVGLLSIISCGIIVSYYSVVGGWSMDYLARSVFKGFEGMDKDGISSLFGAMSSSLTEPVLFHTLFLGTTALIILGGVKNGIEKFTKITMPVLAVLMVLIAIYSMCLPGARAGINYLLKPDFSHLTSKAFAYAMGQSFFSLSLGVGTVLTYSSYMRKQDSILSSGISTAVFDTLFAIVAGFAVMPAVFAAGIAPGTGPSLVFETLPFIFSDMSSAVPLIGRAVTIVFFLSILFAALTSEISMLEVCVSFLVEHKGMSRFKATLLLFVITWIVGVLCALSFGPLSGISIFGHSIFSAMDTLASNYLMTLGALAFALFVGWKLDRRTAWETFTNNGTLKVASRIFNPLLFCIRWIIPFIILVIFLTNL